MRMLPAPMAPAQIPMLWLGTACRHFRHCQRRQRVQVSMPAADCDTGNTSILFALKPYQAERGACKAASQGPRLLKRLYSWPARCTGCNPSDSPVLDTMQIGQVVRSRSMIRTDNFLSRKEAGTKCTCQLLPPRHNTSLIGPETMWADLGTLNHWPQ